MDLTFPSVDEFLKCDHSNEKLNEVFLSYASADKFLECDHPFESIILQPEQYLPVVMFIFNVS